jgi:hypothetical protein
MSTLSADELHIMEHTTGWKSKQPLYRNHFVTGPECDNWKTLNHLCDLGMMRISRGPSDLTGGDFVFQVTKAGIELLKKRDDGCI